MKTTKEKRVEEAKKKKGRRRKKKNKKRKEQDVTFFFDPVLFHATTKISNEMIENKNKECKGLSLALSIPPFYIRLGYKCRYFVNGRYSMVFKRK